MIIKFLEIVLVCLLCVQIATGALTVTRIENASGLPAGGNTVTIHGTDFSNTGNQKCRWNQDNALKPNAVVLNSTVLTCQVPALPNGVAKGYLLEITMDNAAYITAGYYFTFISTEEKLVTADVSNGDLCGQSMRVDPTGLAFVIGCPDSDNTQSNSGSAYVFAYNTTTATWSQQSKLLQQNTQNLRAGQDVSISFDTIAVTSTAFSSSRGRVYLYRRSDFGFIRNIDPSDVAGSDKFGSGVDISPQGFLVSCSPEEDPNGDTNSGSMYSFFKNEGGANNWGQIQKRPNPDYNSDNDKMGLNVRVLDNKAILCSENMDGNKGGCLIVAVDNKVANRFLAYLTSFNLARQRSSL